MRGIITMSMLMVALIVMVGMIATTSTAKERLQDALQETLDENRIFYVASDIESTFWRTVKAAIHDSESPQEDSDAFRQRLLQYLSAWTDWAEDYDVDAQVKVLTGRIQNTGTILIQDSRTFRPESDNEMILSTKREFEIPTSSEERVQISVYIVSITRTPDSAGIYVEVSGSKHKTLSTIPAGASYACYRTTLGGGMLGSTELANALENIAAASSIQILGSCQQQ